MIAEPLEKGLAEDIENEVVQITWPRYYQYNNLLWIATVTLGNNVIKTSIGIQWNPSI